MVATLLRLSHSRALPNGLFRVLRQPRVSWSHGCGSFFLFVFTSSDSSCLPCCRNFVRSVQAQPPLALCPLARLPAVVETPAQRWSRDCARPIQRRFIFSKVGSWVLLYGFAAPLKLKSFVFGTFHECGTIVPKLKKKLFFSFLNFFKLAILYYFKIMLVIWV